MTIHYLFQGLAKRSWLVNSSGRVLQPGYNRRFAPLARELKEHFHGGPLLIQVRVNAGPLPPDHWLLDPREGGRLVGEVCHFVDLCSFLCGALPVSAFAQGAEDLLLALKFADGSSASIASMTPSGAVAATRNWAPTCLTA